MLREIRGIDQKSPGRLKRWFQDDYFDLIVWLDDARDVEQFQLCYARDTRRERVLDWRRGRGFQHLKTEQRLAEKPGRDDAWALQLDGVLPYVALKERFAMAAARLPDALRAFIDDKIDAYARPRRYRPAGAITPRWLERLRQRVRNDARSR